MITRLDVASTRKISAGQVITDLASVVKELLENAIDAAATVVTIRLYRYGLDRIVVEDDGEGIAMPEMIDKERGAARLGADTPLLVSRATTKLRHGAATVDVSATGSFTAEHMSLGFRGEALHSLAHVGQVTLQTMHASDAPYTVELSYNHLTGTMTYDVSRARQETGTTVTVAQLFCGLPVRLRELQANGRKQLMKSTHVVRQYAVSHPHLRLVMMHQECSGAAPVTLVALSGSGDLQRSVAEAYGGLCLSRMRSVHWRGAFGEVHGLVSRPDGGRLSGDQQVFALDGRLVDLPRFARAVQDAFVQCLPNTAKRLSVAFFLQLTLPPDVRYDINLAPNKRKVLFTEEDKLVSALYDTAVGDFRHAADVQAGHGQVPQTPRMVGASDETDRLARAEVFNRSSTPAISLTQYVFRASKRGRSRSRSYDDNNSSASLVHLPKLGAYLYNSDTGALAAKRTRETETMVDSATTTSQSSEEDGLQNGPRAATAEMRHTKCEACVEVDDEDNVKDQLSAAASCGDDRHERDEGGDLGNDEYAAMNASVTVMTDGANRTRECGPQLRCRLPRLSGAPPLPLRACPAHTAACATATPRHFSRLERQSDAELTTYFAKSSFKNMRVVGQFNQGFIITALGDDLFILDQHASDEKYNYECLMRSYVAKPQPLVVPMSLAMDACEVELAVMHAAELRQHGFAVRPGEDATKLLVETIPVLPYDVVCASDVQELVRQLCQYGRITQPLRAVWHSMSTKACRSSIMIGTALSEPTMRLAVRRLAELAQPWNCPHGRPTMRHLGRLGTLSGLFSS